MKDLTLLYLTLACLTWAALIIGFTLYIGILP